MKTEDIIAFVLTGIFLACATVSLVLKAPPVITASSVAATLTAVLYRFLGGLGGVSITIKTVKATGSLATVIILIRLINPGLEKYNPVVIPNPDSWVALNSNGEFIPVTIGGDTYEQNATEFLQDAVWYASRDSGRFRAEKGSYDLASLDLASLERLGLFDRIEMSSGKSIQYSGRLTAGSEFDFSPVYLLKIRATQFKDEYNGFEILDTSNAIAFGPGLLRTRNFQFFEHAGDHYLVFVSGANHMPAHKPPWTIFGLTQVTPELRPP